MPTRDPRYVLDRGEYPFSEYLIRLADPTQAFLPVLQHWQWTYEQTACPAVKIPGGSGSCARRQEG